MATEIQIPEGVKVEVLDNGEQVKISGKLGSTVKKVNTLLITARAENGRLVIEPVEGKEKVKRAILAETALSNEIKRAIHGVQEGITKHMKVIYSHFPMSFEIKDKEVYVKNMFGERLPRIAKIVGDTKVEIKGQDVYVSGVDPYDVGQTVANLFKLSFLKDKDSRVFQDGIYLLKEE